MRLKGMLVVTLALLAGSALAENSDKEAEEAVATFKKAFSSKEESARLSAVEALASTQSHKVVDALAGPLRSDKESSVRRACAKVIGSQWDKSAATTLLKALNPDDPAKDVTTAIITALGENENEVAVPSLLELLTPKKKGAAAEAPDFTGPAITALKRIGSARATDDLITFLTRESAGQGRGGKRGGGGGGGQRGGDPLGKDAEGALSYITGQHFTSATDWRKWWNDNKDSIKLVPVYRCTGTGKTFDKPDSKTKCPYDGDTHASCGYLLKTRFPNGGMGTPDAAGSSGGEEPKKHNKGKGGNGGNNGGNGGNNNN